MGCSPGDLKRIGVIAQMLEVIGEFARIVEAVIQAQDIAVGVDQLPVVPGMGNEFRLDLVLIGEPQGPVEEPGVDDLEGRNDLIAPALDLGM